jgi:DNA-binding transcriptional LysR family regulator
MTTQNEKKLRKLHSSALTYFVSVANEGSFRGAARKLHVASSAVNRHVLLLEQELGFALFDRRGHNLQLTDAGQVVLRHCIGTMRGFDDALEQLDALRNVRSGVVRVAASESFAAEIVPEMCAEFSEAHPNVRIDVTVSASDQVLAAVAQDECDVGFAFGVRGGDAREVASFELPVGAIVGPKHPLAARKAVSLRECSAYPLVIPDQKLSFRRCLDEVSDTFRDGRKGGIEASSPRLMLGIARMNHHVAFQTKVGLARDLRNGTICFLRLTDRGLKSDRVVIVASPKSEGRFAAQEFSAFAAHALKSRLG